VLRQLRIEDLVSRLVQLNGSDLHLKVGAARVRGLLEYLEGYEVLRPVDTEERLKGIIPKKLVEEFEEDGEADFSYAVQGVGRFRVNAFRQRGSVSS
jgi:twitching motility protein PilT